MWARRHGTKFNGAPYIVQRAGEATYSPEGKAQLKEQIANEALAGIKKSSKNYAMYTMWITRMGNWKSAAAKAGTIWYTSWITLESTKFPLGAYTLIFPIILGTLFQLSFGGFLEKEVIFHQIPVAYVESENADPSFLELLKALETQNSLIQVQLVDMEKARLLLENEEVEGLCIAIMMVSSFFSGLMIADIRWQVETYAPWFASINPTSLLTKAFYSLNVYETYTRYAQSMGMLLLLSFLFSAGAFAIIRRERYASI